MSGSAGCGKTLLAKELLARGATAFGEAGVLVAFGKTTEALTANVASPGLDLPALQAAARRRLDHLRVERPEMEGAGEYDPEGLFIHCRRRAAG